MKKTLVLLAFFGLSLEAYAAQMLLEVPEALSIRSVVANPDGSVSAFEPSYNYDGVPQKIDVLSVWGVCSLLQKNLVSFEVVNVKLFKHGETFRIVSLDAQGRIKDSRQTSFEKVLSIVRCR